MEKRLKQLNSKQELLVNGVALDDSASKESVRNTRSRYTGYLNGILNDTMQEKYLMILSFLMELLYSFENIANRLSP